MNFKTIVDIDDWNNLYEHNLLKTSKKFFLKIFPIIKFPYLCLPNKWGVVLYCLDRPQSSEQTCLKQVKDRDGNYIMPL